MMYFCNVYNCKNIFRLYLYIYIFQNLKYILEDLFDCYKKKSDIRFFFLCCKNVFFSLHISVMSCHRTIWWSHMWPVCFSNFLLLWKQTEVYFLAVVDVPFTPLHVIEKPEDLTRCLARCCSISLVQNDWLYFSCVPLFKCTRVFLCTAVNYPVNWTIPFYLCNFRLELKGRLWSSAWL